MTCLDPQTLKIAKDEAIHICQKTAEGIRSLFPLYSDHSCSKDVSYSMKSNNPTDLVTLLDRSIESDIKDHLTKCFPDYGFIGEEGGLAHPFQRQKDTTPYWIVDPIDGTTNFVHKFPQSCISIGLVSNGEPVVGVIYHPIQQTVYWAIKGQGAYKQDISSTKRLDVNASITGLKQALVCTEFGSYEWKLDKSIRSILSEQRDRLCRYPVQGIRCLGSAALNLAHLACGQLDIYFQYGIHAWDLAAGVLLVREAGGVVVNLHRQDTFDLYARNVLACATDFLLQSFIKDIVDVDQEDREGLSLLVDFFEPDKNPHEM